jgi:hypothetical protein
LRPEDLRVKRDVIGSPAMNIEWDHPRAKKPENGYRLVFAPFSHIADQKPWFENVDKDAKNVINIYYLIIILSRIIGLEIWI